MVITLNQKTPIILIGSNRSSLNFIDKNRKELVEYFLNDKESKLGILTNGLVYKFYSVMWNESKKPSNYPFMVFDLRDFTRADLLFLLPKQIEI